MVYGKFYGKFYGRLNGCCEMVVVERYCLELLRPSWQDNPLVIQMLRASTPFWQDSPLIEYFKFYMCFRASTPIMARLSVYNMESGIGPPLYVLAQLRSIALVTPGYVMKWWMDGIRMVYMMNNMMVCYDWYEQYGMYGMTGHIYDLRLDVIFTELCALTCCAVCIVGQAGWEVGRIVQLD